MILFHKMLSISHRFLFVHIPKTGGNSIQNLLRRYSEDKIITDPLRDGVHRFEVRGTYTRHKHAGLSDYRAALPRDLYDELFKFCVVRNPWSRLISFYFSPSRWLRRSARPYWSRDEFVALLRQVPNMVDYLKVDGEIQPMSFVIRYENIAEDFSEAMSMIGIADGKCRLPHVNKGFADDYRSYYRESPDLVRIVGRKCAEDIEHFGYEFEG